MVVDRGDLPHVVEAIWRARLQGHPELVSPSEREAGEPLELARALWPQVLEPRRSGDLDPNRSWSMRPATGAIRGSSIRPAYRPDSTSRGKCRDAYGERPVPRREDRDPAGDELQDEGLSELFDWTTHNHEVIPKGDTTLLVSGDYHEGLVVYDSTDPTDPTPTDEFETVDDSDENNIILGLGDPPMAWGANYSEQRDLVLVSDFVTGAWTFKVVPSASNTRGNRGGN